MSTVVIIGRHDDPHTEAVTLALKALGRKVECLDSFRGDPVHVCISSNGERHSRWQSIRSFNFKDDRVDGVWMRQKPVIPLPWWSPLQHDAARFAQSEWRAVIQTLEDYLPSACWINSPEAQRRISYKPRQLSLAASVGFQIPETTITNDPQAVSALVQRYGKAIYKNFSGYIFTDQTGILTTLITLEMLMTNQESIRRAPGIYQQFIDKKSEARVTVVGDCYFTAFIRTPKTGPGSVDWRHSQFEDIFEEGELPDDIASCIKRFQEAAGIRYGAYDFIISPDGTWYFLECNPAGQFLWLEHALGYRVSSALAEELSGEK